MALETGQRVGDYEILALIGSGGMGRVYKARNIISSREEALKILLPDFASEPELTARFMGEIRTLAGLEHPNIAQLRTAFQFENQLVMVMEFVEGVGLEKLTSESKIPLDQALEYALQALSALGYAHGRGVIHRDIKPANIMITAHGLVKLMDFGIAKGANDLNLTRPGTTMGSVYYMSPEQVRGGAVDARSDLYSFGVTLYEILTGRKPFQADTSYSVLSAQLNQAPMPPIQVNPALPPELNNIVLRAMEKNPDARFQTAEEFRVALKTLREPQLVAQPAASTAPPQPGFVPVFAPAAVAPQPAKNHRGLWIGLGALVAVLALVAVAAVLPRLFPAKAGGKTGPDANPATTASPVQPGPSNAGPAAQPNVPAPATAPASNSGAKPSYRPAYVPPAAATSSVHPNGATGAQESSAAPSTPAATPSAPPPGPSPEQLRNAQDRLLNLKARADAARSGVQQIRSQQQASGLDIRGDILAAMSRMDNFLQEAGQAISQQDLQTANDYMDRADKQIATLESFLGR